MVPANLYGLLAEFDHAEELVEATRRARSAGFRCLDAYAPMPVHGLTEALGRRATRLPFLTLLGGVLGAVAGYAFQYWYNVIEYPMNIGGRPHHSWPAFVPVVFECTVLGAALFTVLSILGLNGLPQPYHPLFHIDAFRLASRNRFFLCIEARDARFAVDDTRRFLEELHPRNVYEVPL
jgi:hypothetical protein